jgi:hypothetical protein
MNDGNVRYYLEQELKRIATQIADNQRYVIQHERVIDDLLKITANLKVHYTSLLNTAIAYGLDKKEFEESL